MVADKHTNIAVHHFCSMVTPFLRKIVLINLETCALSFGQFGLYACKYGAPFVSKLETFQDITNKSLFIKVYGSLRQTFQFQYKGVLMSSSASLNNRPKIYNQSQACNLTGNISLMVDSKRQLMVLVLHVLLSNNKK